jgi:hypothetical protein
LSIICFSISTILERRWSITWKSAPRLRNESFGSSSLSDSEWPPASSFFISSPSSLVLIS